MLLYFCFFVLFFLLLCINPLPTNPKFLTAMRRLLETVVRKRKPAGISVCKSFQYGHVQHVQHAAVLTELKSESHTQKEPIKI